MKTAILGAGVSGLALARCLTAGGLQPAQIHLFESAAAVGGLCASKTVDGFTYDVTGGHVLYSKDQDVLHWMMDCSGGDQAFVRCHRNTKIRVGDRFVHYPFENGLSDLTPDVNFECLSGYVQAWHSRQQGSQPPPDDFKGWIRWRFGDGIARHFMDPYNEKIWKRDLAHISSSWVAGRVPDAPVDDVLRASIGIRTEGYKHQAIFFYPKRGGFQAITDGIAAPVLPRVRLSTPVCEIARDRGGWKVNGESFDCVVSTLPLDALPDAMPGMPPTVGEVMRALQYNSIVCYLLALDRPQHPDYSWLYLPYPEQGPANRVTYLSNYSQGNAPKNKTSLLCEVTLRPGDPPPGPELEREVIAGLERAGLVRKGEILFTDHTYTRRAYIVFDHGYSERRRTALEWLDGQGIHALGRFGRYDYDNSDQCVIKARALASELLKRAARG